MPRTPLADALPKGPAREVALAIAALARAELADDPTLADRDARSALMAFVRDLAGLALDDALAAAPSDGPHGS